MARPKSPGKSCSSRVTDPATVPPNDADCESASSTGIAGFYRLALILAVLLLAFFLRFYRLPSVPFGWHPDEATKGLLARDVLAGKYYPAFFSAFTGREALYVYLEAAAFALFGEGIFAARVLSAFIGVLTIAATYRLGREWFNRRVGLFAAALLAASLWHLIASRNSYRAVIQPLIQLPALLFLFRGWRAPRTPRSRWQFVIAGIFIGLSQYTYTAARFFPVFIAATMFFAWLLAPPLVNRRWKSLLMMILVSLVIFIPLGLHFYRRPIDFYGRAAQISVFSPQWAGGKPGERLWQSVKETARMFTQWGDPNFRFNLAGRPVFGVIDGVLFYGGLLLCLWGAVVTSARPKRGHRHLVHITLLLWLVIMLLPMTLSAEGLPYYQRAIGILPAVYFFPALSLDILAQQLKRLTRPLAYLFPAILLIGLTVRTHQEYFIDWHTARRNDDDRNVAMVYAANYLKREQPQGELYLSTRYAQHPTLAFLSPERYDGIHWFDAQQSLPLPPVDVEATYLLLLEDPPQPKLLAQVPSLKKVHTAQDRFDRPIFEVYHWQGDTHPAPSDQSQAFWSWATTFDQDFDEQRHPIELPVNFGNTMMFLGHDRSAEKVRAGETLELVLYWHLLRRPERHYSIFAHLLDDQSQIVGEYDANRYATSFWRESGGEMLLSYFPLRVKPGTPPGEYQLEIGVYHQPSGERMPIYQHGEIVADRLLLRPVDVQ